MVYGRGRETVQRCWRVALYLLCDGVAGVAEEKEEERRKRHEQGSVGAARCQRVMCSAPSSITVHGAPPPPPPLPPPDCEPATTASESASVASTASQVQVDRFALPGR